MAAAGVAVARTLSAEEVFDDIGPAYETAFADLTTQAKSIDWLLERLQSSRPAKCLDIGCGTGRPVCSSLAEAGHDVLGIDVSGAMITDAQQKVPRANFQKIDIMDFRPQPATFHAITVYFSMIASTTPDQIRQNIKNIYSWLRPGGLFVFATVPIRADSETIKWMGRSVVVSSLEAEEAVQCVKDAGFEVLYHGVSSFTPNAERAGICSQTEVWEEPHLLIYARKA